MKYAILAAAFAVTASFGVSAQAAPAPVETLTVEAAKGGSVQKVWHRRRWHRYRYYRWHRWHRRHRWHRW